jgi:hypothetical protein
MLIGCSLSVDSTFQPFDHLRKLCTCVRDITIQSIIEWNTNIPIFNKRNPNILVQSDTRQLL